MGLRPLAVDAWLEAVVARKLLGPMGEWPTGAPGAPRSGTGAPSGTGADTFSVIADQRKTANHARESAREVSE